MAVENKYIDANVAAGKLTQSVKASLGSERRTFITTFETAAADDNLSVYRLFKNLSPDFIPISISIRCDAITGGTDYDVGFYITGTDGAEIDGNILADAIDLSSAVNATPKDGLKDVDLADRVKKIYELCGHTQSTKKSGYDLCLTANTVGSAAGTITVHAEFAQG